MPTIEFFGYRQEERRHIQFAVRERLAPESFHSDCVFVESTPSRVLDWNGEDRPFVRVSTRSADRAARFRALLEDLCDLEVVHIDFQPMQNSVGSGRMNGNS